MPSMRVRLTTFSTSAAGRQSCLEHPYARRTGVKFGTIPPTGTHKKAELPPALKRPRPTTDLLSVFMEDNYVR